MITKTEIRPGAYFDSVILMQLQRSLVELPGVEDAGVVMATPANKELLADGELLPREAQAAGADDLLIVVKSADEAGALDAIAQVDSLIAARRSTSTGHSFRPRSVASAARALPDAQWVLISVPGRYAADVAREALSQNKHVFLYSDNVTIEDEVSLKQAARDRGLLVMGPDCGTAIINGTGLGFANRVRRGRIGVVGASGTGIQAVTAAVHNLGHGISQAIGTGGRDLKGEVGAVTALQGLDILARDPETEVIVLVSKPPEAEVAARLLAAAIQAGKPAVVNFIGHPPPANRLGSLHFAASLQEAAETAVHLTRSSTTSAAFENGSKRKGWLRGLFSGGTLAYEMVLGLQNFIAPLYTNVPLQESQRLENPLDSKAHTILDLGEDEFTVGRLHPMMDNDLRIRRMRQEAADPETAMLLLDLVLGEGAHPGPAAELAPVIREITGKDIPVAVLVIGSDEDPQDTLQQIETLEEAGAHVYRRNTELLEDIVPQFLPPALPFPEVPLGDSLAAINVGLESFYDSLTGQGVKAIHVDWRPPAGGNQKMMDILARLKDK